jgi:hypothetical protein
MFNRRIVEVAGEKAVLIDERYDGYQAELVRTLVAAIQVQGEGLSDKGRKEKVGKVVEALGSVAATKMEAG